LAIEVAVNYHRAFSLSRYYIGYVKYTSEGIYEYYESLIAKLKLVLLTHVSK